MERFLQKRAEAITPTPLTEAGVSNRLRALVDFYQSHSLDARLIGSTGRYAIFQQNPPDTRTQHGQRDFDFLLLGFDQDAGGKAILQEARKIASPIYVDHFRQTEKRIVAGEDTAVIRYRNITCAVDPRIFELREGKVFGVVVPTFDPNTLFHLQAIATFARPKDLQAFVEFRRAYMTMPDVLPEELFQPFHELAELRMTQYPHDAFINEFALWYRTHLPGRIKHALQPAANFARKRFIEK
ncbi:MAG: hypothetical protein Q8Q49_05760 [bacterium]|nr:hypothetical protein [bacterium]